MMTQEGSATGNRPKMQLDVARLRMLVFQINSEHAQLRLPLVRLGAAGTALAANPQNSASRHEAREAWRQMLDVIEQHMNRREDEEALKAAETLKVMTDETAQAMIAVCNKLKELEHQISQIDFELSPPDLWARAGEAMRQFAVILDDLVLREDRELLPRLQRIAYGPGTNPKR